MMRYLAPGMLRRDLELIGLQQMSRGIFSRR